MSIYHTIMNQEIKIIMFFSIIMLHNTIATTVILLLLIKLRKLWPLAMGFLFSLW